MRVRNPACLIGVSAALALTPAFGQGDAAAGRALAAQWCSRCHNIEPDGPMKLQPPAFAAIAAYRSPGYIRSNIMTPHGGMPEVAQILGLNTDDLVAYIVSLERR